VSALFTQFGERDALLAKREGEFATMMEVVGNNVPDNPLARESIVFPLYRVISE